MKNYNNIQMELNMMHNKIRGRANFTTQYNQTVIDSNA